MHLIKIGSLSVAHVTDLTCRTGGLENGKMQALALSVAPDSRVVVTPSRDYNAPGSAQLILTILARSASDN